MREFIQHKARLIGFDACGFARAEELTEDAGFLNSWLTDGMHGDMHYLERNFEKRIDPRVLVPGCKTVIVLLLNYFPEKQQNLRRHKIAKYAYPAIDYHFTIKDMLRRLESAITLEAGEDCFSHSQQHSFVDSAPVLERRWAQKAGLGWLGKHTQLIAPGFGSYVFIATLMLNKELPVYDSPIADRCGSCTRCIDACPTQALVPGTLNASKCISYLTIETKKEVTPDLKEKLSGYRVGCDICADVCPWNKKWALPHRQEALKPSEVIYNWKEEDWDKATSVELRQAFRKSAVLRALRLVL
jgi:epoxyqueuosine reductase